jgi:hypothetical protein
MTPARAALSSLAWLLPALGLAIGVWPHLRNGLAREAAIPVPSYMVARISMPKIAYRTAANALADADARDGDAHIARGEALMALSESPVADLKLGLRHAPASARGWTLLAEASIRSDRKQAARYLGQAMLLAPYDYWLSLPLAQDAARLWPDLDDAARARAVAQARTLWADLQLRRNFQFFASTPEGVQLAWRTFAYQPDELQQINRWLVQNRPAVRH